MLPSTLLAITPDRVVCLFEDTHIELSAPLAPTILLQYWRLTR